MSYVETGINLARAYAQSPTDAALNHLRDHMQVMLSKAQALKAERDELRASARVPHGWKLVPNAPTEEWIDNLERKHGDPDAVEMQREGIAACIAELLLASPAAEAAEKGKS